jgi:hypothetical protein
LLLEFAGCGRTAVAGNGQQLAAGLQVLVQAADAALRVEREDALERLDGIVEAVADQRRLGELNTRQCRAAIRPVTRRDRLIQGDRLGGSLLGLGRIPGAQKRKRL